MVNISQFDCSGGQEGEKLGKLSPFEKKKLGKCGMFKFIREEEQQGTGEFLPNICLNLQYFGYKVCIQS